MAKGRKSKPVSEAVKAAADAAERRSKGIAETEPRAAIDTPRKDRGKSERPKAAPEAAPVPLPKIGRPTKYRPEFCERVVACGAEGMGKAEIAAQLATDRSTLDEWAKRYPQFSSAMRYAQVLSLAWWERQGRAGINAGKDFNAAAFCFQMKNRFRDDYCERTETTHKLDASASFLQLFQAISAGQGAKLIEGKAS